MVKMALLTRLEEESQKKLDEFLQNIDNRDLVWMDEILEEAIKMFSSSSSNGEPLLMPKTPSQKNRQKKKRFSSAKHDQFAKKRLSKRDGNRSSSSKQICQRDLDITKADIDNISPCCRMTRSRALRSARTSHVALKNPSIHLVEGRIPLVEISSNERKSAESHMAKTPPQKEKVALSITLCDESSTKKSQPLSKVSLIMIPDTPEAQITKEGRGASKLKIANISVAKTTESKEPSTSEKTICVQDQETCHPSEMEVMQNLSESPETPKAPKPKRQSVRRSLMGRPSLNCKASLVERCSLSVKRELMVQKSVAKTLSKRKTAQRSSAACGRASSQAAIHSVDEEITESRPEVDPTSHSQEVNQNIRMSLRSHKSSMTTSSQSQEDKQEGDCTVSSSEKREEMQKPSKNVGRQASYKRALGETEDEQHTEDKLSPPRKKAPSSPCLASKVVRPFKTFLHTVHKNQMLMTTPGSMSRNSTIKSFLKQNTPLRTTPQEKERQRFENLRKKEEAEQYRKQKLEEEKRRRLEDMKRKREERLRKVLQARERVEQMEEEKKKRLEQKLAQHEEKNEKEKMAEDKVKKKVAAKKLEEIEARRKQEDEARRQKALQLEEEERRHRELMQKKKEEEQEKARKIAEQRRAELEKEKNLIAEKELQKKREQEKLQAQREFERQEKEKAARLQREVLAAAKEKERLRKEMEEKERKLQEQQKQEDQQQKAEAEAKAAKKQLNVTVDIENSPVCNSYQMTPQSQKQPKIELSDYGMDLNSDDSTDDESQPRKPIPSWATGNELSQAVIHQYYNPPNIRTLFGIVKSPKLEEIFQKSKPRYFKRTSSAVWNSPPFPGGKSVTSAFKRW
ncbi:hypothetical protein JD844_022068 [Phrynosoma platyrhinos]|uniref:Inner centromere protein n=1 Tax=Phrynosoma platyrhinos TaxID=52577 RepID=A0ABQ7SUE5_PHRPL|nr:hypothetical protein JD844_022068 [Phrynosoma platyrhinos]